jgi:hypothetical protein
MSWLAGDYKTRNETEMKRNTTETKWNETRHNRNETKKIINKKKNEFFFFTWDNNLQNASGRLKNL